MSCRLVPLQSAHLPQVVDLHTRAFPGFFLSFLGPRFLQEFYASFLHDSAGVSFVAEGESGSVLGVVVGPLDPRGYFKRLMRRRWWAFGAASVRAILTRPSIASRLLLAVFYRGEAPPDRPRSLLSSIAVAPEAQGQGIGAALVRRWMEETRRRGSSGCYLTTDAEGNDDVNDFYRRVGWVLESTYDATEGRRMNRYVFDFADGTSTE
jgi:colanic acid biosynthesis glycosyl transferase WcaI